MITTKNVHKMANTEAIKLNERVTVYATDKLKSRTPGQELSLHPKQAAAFIQSGKATEKPVAGTSKEKGGKV